MKRIAYITTTRADFSLNYPIIAELRKLEDENLKVELIVSGTHLSTEYGMTIGDIRETGLRIDHIVKVPVLSHSAINIANNQVVILDLFSKLFQENKFDAVCILGDRYEMLMITIAAIIFHIPVIHLYGGDTTEGANDELFRHAITKMSNYHFATNELSKNRIIQMGENPDNVYNFGAPAIDNLIRISKVSKVVALDSIHLHNCKYALCTYHPVTLEIKDLRKQANNLINAITTFKDIEFIVCKSNNDEGGEIINKIFEFAAEKYSNIHLYSSIRIETYLTLMKYAEFVIGNSSSGIMEAPSFGIPSINIGNRQRGRLQAASTINCDSDSLSIISAIQQATSTDFIQTCRNVTNPYGNGNSAPLIANKIKEIIKSHIEMKKKFFMMN